MIALKHLRQSLYLNSSTTRGNSVSMFSPQRSHAIERSVDFLRATETFSRPHLVISSPHPTVIVRPSKSRGFPEPLHGVASVILLTAVSSLAKNSLHPIWFLRHGREYEDEVLPPPRYVPPF